MWPYCSFTAIYFWKAEINFPLIPVTSLQCCRLREFSNANVNTYDFLWSCINMGCEGRTWKRSSLLCLMLLKRLLEYCIRLWALGSP